VRPLSEKVTVRSAGIKKWTVKATLDLYDGPDRGLVIAQALKNGWAYADEQHRLGGIVTRSGLDAAFHVAGVRNVALTNGNDSSWVDVVCGDHEAAFCDGLEVV